MDKQQLEAYRSNKAEIIELKHKLAHLVGDESLIGNSVILDGRKGYLQPQSVVGYDYNLEQRRRERWRSRIEKLQAEVDEVEAWIEEIPDGVTRRCFRMVYVDGLTQRRVAQKLHMDKSTVGRKIDGFLKVAPNAPNAPL